MAQYGEVAIEARLNAKQAESLDAIGLLAARLLGPMGRREFQPAPQGAAALRAPMEQPVPSRLSRAHEAAAQPGDLLGARAAPLPGPMPPSSSPTSSDSSNSFGQT